MFGWAMTFLVIAIGHLASNFSGKGSSGARLHESTRRTNARLKRRSDRLTSSCGLSPKMGSLRTG